MTDQVNWRDDPGIHAGVRAIRMAEEANIDCDMIAKAVAKQECPWCAEAGDVDKMRHHIYMEHNWPQLENYWRISTFWLIG